MDSGSREHFANVDHRSVERREKKKLLEQFDSICFLQELKEQLLDVRLRYLSFLGVGQNAQ